MTPAPSPLLRQIHFEGHALNIISVDGRPAWIATELGEALGYAEGRVLVNTITDRWSTELVEGVDYALIVGAELERLRGGVRRNAGVGLQQSAATLSGGRLLILFETGLHLVLLKTSKPAGMALRRMLATSVLPQLARGEGLPSTVPTVGQAARVVRQALDTIPIKGASRLGVEVALEVLEAEHELGRPMPAFRTLAFNR